MQKWKAEEVEILKEIYKQGDLKEIKSEIPLALDGGMNDNNRTAGTVGIAYWYLAH